MLGVALMEVFEKGNGGEMTDMASSKVLCAFLFLFFGPPPFDLLVLSELSTMFWSFWPFGCCQKMNERLGGQ